MNIHYKIIELWPNDHLIVARYWTDNITEEMLASDGNRKEDGTPVRCRTDVSFNLSVPPEEGEDLNKLIVKNTPLNWLKLLESVLDPNINTDINHIAPLVGVTKSINEETLIKLTAAPTMIVPELQESEIEELLKGLKN
jgi:hypothetical protein